MGNDREPAMAGCGDGARQCGQFPAPEAPQRFQWSHGTHPVECGLDDIAFVAEHRPHDTGAGTDPVSRRTPQNRGRHCRRGGGVGYADLSHNEEISVAFVDRARARSHGRVEVVGGHGVSDTNVAGGPADAHVDEVEGRTDPGRENRHGRFAAADRVGHRRGDFSRVGAHAVGGNPVIRGEHHDMGLFDLGRRCALPAGQPRRHRIEPGERSRGPKHGRRSARHRVAGFDDDRRGRFHGLHR